MKILIAEDELISRRLLQKTLEEWGHEVLSSENGNEAWDVFQKENVKLVIADWMMPEMDGIELCRAIRTSESSGYVYFILLTGKDKKVDIVNGLDAGADDYVTKPFERDELKVRLRAGERIINLEKELTEKNKILEELSLMDPLMGIGNRRSFYNTIEKMHDRAVRYGQGYGIIMCDVDFFKTYNDTYGHLLGDQVLKSVAKSVRLSCRTSDEIFRYGGEEIIVLLPGQDCDSTTLVAKRVREGIEKLNIEHKGSKNEILTISCGAAAFTDSDKMGKWEEVIDRADKALYKAKENGRNQVHTLFRHVP